MIILQWYYRTGWQTVFESFLRKECKKHSGGKTGGERGQITAPENVWGLSFVQALIFNFPFSQAITSRIHKMPALASDAESRGWILTASTCPRIALSCVKCIKSRLEAKNESSGKFDLGWQEHFEIWIRINSSNLYLGWQEYFEIWGWITSSNLYSSVRGFCL